MGLSASQGRMLLLTARKSDLEFRAQQISQKRLVLSQQLEEISNEYEEATSNRQMKISLYLQGATDATGKDLLTTTSNLTYATLVSGTLSSIAPAKSGIRAYERTENQDYASNAAYRLTDSNGYIVVSDIAEIPYEGVEYRKASATKNKETGFYETGTKELDGSWREGTKKNFVDISDSEYKNSALKDILESDEYQDLLYSGYGDSAEFLYDGQYRDSYTQVVKILGRYFDLTDGTEIVDDDADEIFSPKNDETVSFVDNKSDIPQVKRAYSTGKGNYITEKGNGVYELYSPTNSLLGKYVVDNGLKGTSTLTDEPNYLQDCLRNGKYLLQKATINNADNEVSWRSLSWDAATNIMDSYFMEDDDKAKAKYDRLQTQVQNLDKKLELELDNIETQRTAVSKEQESVEKVIDDNIEGSFNTFA